MTKPIPTQGAAEPSTVEHDAPDLLRTYTAWHHFLARVLEKTRAPGFDVQCFVRLGTLPLEADIIILHLDEQADTREFAKHFGFLMPSLRKYLILEYKSPQDRLAWADFDTVRAYALLCKRKYDVVHDHEVAVAMLYSRTEADFFSRCAHNGFPFAELQPGVRHCGSQAMGLYAADLVALGEQQPAHPINLLSARRREFKASAGEMGLGPFSVLYEEVFLRELKKMSQMHVPGYEELLDDAQRTLKLVLAASTVEQRLDGISPRDRLRGLSPDEVLRNLSPEEKARLRELLKQESI